jgi:hypothetical protein
MGDIRLSKINTVIPRILNSLEFLTSGNAERWCSIQEQLWRRNGRKSATITGFPIAEIVATFDGDIVPLPMRGSTITAHEVTNFSTKDFGFESKRGNKI